MATQQYLEVEAKFTVTEATPMVDLTRLPAIDAARQTFHHSLSAIYYDTPDLRLTRSKITLRRRTGGDDDGWHLKLPGDSGRVEIHHELGEPIRGQYRVPRELVSHVRALVRDEKLEPIAQVDNERTETTFVDAQGREVCEFCDDRVTAVSLLPGGTRRAWREWEVELSSELAGTLEGAALMRTATNYLIGAGARMSTSSSKLAAALGDSIAQAPVPKFVRQPDVDFDSPAFAVVQALRANRDKLLEYDPKVRNDEWDSVHQMRVATRELRSHMKTFDGVIGGEKVDRVEAELKLLAGMLGVARDAEVVEERFQWLIDSEDSGELDDAVRQHVRADMREQYRNAHEQIVRVLNSRRYWRLLDDLDDILVNPPLVSSDNSADSDSDSSGSSGSSSSSDGDRAGTTDSQPAQPAVSGQSAQSPANAPEPAQRTQAEQSSTEPSAKPAAKSSSSTASDADMASGEVDLNAVLAEHVYKAYKKLMKRHRKAVDNWDNTELTLHQREDYYHDMRKSAKKLRYAAEAASEASSLKTKKLYKACKRLQSTLGDFQDSVTSRDKLLELTAAARARGEDTFGYGLLYQRERSIGLEALDAYNSDVSAIRSAFKPLRKKIKH